MSRPQYNGRFSKAARLMAEGLLAGFRRNETMWLVFSVLQAREGAGSESNRPENLFLTLHVGGESVGRDFTAQAHLLTVESLELSQALFTRDTGDEPARKPHSRIRSEMAHR